jgi:hypothetical protein
MREADNAKQVSSALGEVFRDSREASFSFLAKSDIDEKEVAEGLLVSAGDRIAVIQLTKISDEGYFCECGIIIVLAEEDLSNSRMTNQEIMSTNPLLFGTPVFAINSIKVYTRKK